MAKFYIKLLHAILADSKMGLLPDRLWRRVIELFLLAGVVDQGGWLPGLPEMCWALHQSPEALLADLAALAEIKIVRLDDESGRWLVINFKKYQDADSQAERAKRYRDRKSGRDLQGTLLSPVEFLGALAGGAQPSQVVTETVTNTVTSHVPELKLKLNTLTLTESAKALAERFIELTGCEVIQDNVLLLESWVQTGVIPDDINDAVRYFGSLGLVPYDLDHIALSVVTGKGMRLKNGRKTARRPRSGALIESSGDPVDDVVDETVPAPIDAEADRIWNTLLRSLGASWPIQHRLEEECGIVPAVVDGRLVLSTDDAWARGYLRHRAMTTMLRHVVVFGIEEILVKEVEREIEAGGT